MIGLSVILVLTSAVQANRVSLKPCMDLNLVGTLKIKS